MSGHGYRVALSAEWLKIRRSKAPLATAVVFTAVPAIAALFMLILTDPARARSMGLLNQKAQLSGLTADWAGLLEFLSQVIAVGDLIVFAFIVAWVFGREFTDGTLRYLLALPVGRTTIVLAKFTVVAVWAALLSLWLLVLFGVVGWAMALPGWSGPVVVEGVATSMLAAALMLLVTTPVALVACLGHGHLPAVGSAIGALVLAQLAAALGWATLVPWSVPAVAAGLAPGAQLGPASLAVVGLTAVLGVAGTAAWWRSGLAGL